MTINFLGTGTSQGVPVIACNCDVCSSNDLKDKRLRSSIMISWSDFNFVIDTGPDFRYQMLRAEVKSLDAVVYTHEHKDHVAGLDDVRAFNFIQKKAMEIYGHPRVLKELKREFPYVFSGVNYPGIPKLNLNEIHRESGFKLGGKEIIPVEVMHYKLPVLGFRVENFCYITDANYISESEKEKLKGLDVLVLNALRLEEHISHFNLDQALELIEELKPKKCCLTHISHLLGKHEEISEKLPEHVMLAYDMLKIELP